MAGSGSQHMRSDRDPVLSVEDMVVEFEVGHGQVVHAVSGMNFDLLPGETLGILGESGCGKSTAGRAIMQSPPPTSGTVRFGEAELTELPRRRLRRERSHMQMIMQDPVSSLNPRRKVKDLVAEGLAIWGYEGDDKDAHIREVLSDVGLDPDAVWHRRPHELSGGQCQRVCIARALMMDPQVLICDEPVSSLDVSVQAQILNLLEETKERYGLSMMFIAHDVSVVKNVSDQVMVLYLARPARCSLRRTCTTRPFTPTRACYSRRFPVRRRPTARPCVPPSCRHRSILPRAAGSVPGVHSPPIGAQAKSRSFAKFARGSTWHATTSRSSTPSRCLRRLSRAEERRRPWTRPGPPRSAATVRSPKP